jgi:hypothetical protein
LAIPWLKPGEKPALSTTIAMAWLAAGFQSVTQTIINEDLSTLLPSAKFQQIRKILLLETLSFLEKEHENLSKR